MKFKDRILALLSYSKYVLTGKEISNVIGIQVDDLLIELQDSDDVILKNGFYRLSESARKRLENETRDNS